MASAGDEEYVSMKSMASPMIAASFDVLPSTGGADVSSKMLIHDIVSAKEPKQQQPPNSNVVTPTRSTTPRLPFTAPLISSDLTDPLLDQRGRGRQTPSRSQSIIHQIKFLLFGSLIPDLAEPTCKIEPKTFLANERTFLNWCYVSFIISAVSVTLLSVDPEAHLEAAVLSMVAVVTLAWSLNVYRLRAIALRNMKSLDSLIVSSNGATGVCLSVAFALLVTWMGRLRQYLNDS
jgi:uncharacterized membrane protein YidH (DUF202 family)